MNTDATYVKILKRARKTISRTENDYICFHIEKAAEHLGREVKGEELLNIIAERLFPHAFLGSWLIRVHGIDAYNDTPKLQATRIAWIDDLIKEFS